ncbi:substrate-binding domain-containing protein [Homoserinimonas aerilata]|uniref:sugar ABC transporter substrate-binding protein n=1 Tax=Homoserinimonas aerilata TaxID=1162970 RepID=UPI00163A9193|nr:substrate-binding domain-containing protein [Homoserinimonas aerilata]
MSSLALVGCSGDQGGGTDTGAEGSGNIAVVLKTASNQFWATMQDGAEAAGSDAGVKVTVQSGTAEDSVDEQTTLLQTLAGSDYSCFAVAPITGTNLNQPLASVSQAGIPIVNLDSAIDADAAKASGIEIASFIASNNSDAGKQAGEFMAEKLGDGAKVAVIGGIPGDANSAARTGGFTDAATAAGLTIVQEVNADWDREKALDAATTILRANPDLGGFYAANDGMALGIVQAGQNEGRTDLIIIGTDGNKDAIESIEAGGLSATVSQYPYAVGTLGVDACRALISGATVPAQVDAPIALVSADNATEALASYPKPFQEYDNPFLDLIKK